MKCIFIAQALVLLIVFLSPTHCNGYSLKCDRIPDGAGATKSPADGRFRIRVQGNPERYIPLEVYTSEYKVN